MLRIRPHQRCPVNLKYNPLKTLVYMACRAFFVRDDLNLESNIKTCTGKPLKTASGILHQINNSQGWYQNVLFGGGVLKPRYNLIPIVSTVPLPIPENMPIYMKTFLIHCPSFVV